MQEGWEGYFGSRERDTYFGFIFLPADERHPNRRQAQSGALTKLLLCRAAEISMIASDVSYYWPSVDGMGLRGILWGYLMPLGRLSRADRSLTRLWLLTLSHAPYSRSHDGSFDVLLFLCSILCNMYTSSTSSFMRSLRQKTGGAYSILPMPFSRRYSSKIPNYIQQCWYVPM